MKATTLALRNLLATGTFVRADIWTITLNGGVVVRWTSHDQPISWAGQTYALGPIIQRGKISEKLGLQVSTLDVTITALDSDLINGSPIIGFIAGHGLDGASVKLEAAYAPDWNSPITGTIIRFAGKVTSIGSILGATAMLTVSAWTVLLNASAPRNLYQGGCLRTLYDAGCTLLPSSFSAAGTVTTGGTGSFVSGLTAAAGYYAQGRLVFTSGPNNGISRTVKSYDGAGGFVLVRPLPVACAVGDTFTAYAGCDLAKATCLSKFNNLIHHKATPFVPVPITALGAATTATTTGGKG